MARKTHKLVRIWARPGKNGTSLTYYLRYVDLENKPKIQSLHHSDLRKAEQQALKKEKELRMQYCPPASMRLSEFLKDYLRRADSIRPSTKTEYAHSMRNFIKAMGDMDILQVDHNTGERYRKICLDHGNRPHTVAKKIRQLRAMISAGIARNQLETNPLTKVKTPRVPTNTIIRTYTPDERRRLIKAASEYRTLILLNGTC